MLTYPRLYSDSSKLFTRAATKNGNMAHVVLLLDSTNTEKQIFQGRCLKKVSFKCLFAHPRPGLIWLDLHFNQRSQILPPQLMIPQAQYPHRGRYLLADRLTGLFDPSSR